MIRRQRNGVAWWTFADMAAEPGLVQAFSTRQGGVSDGVYASLNLSLSTGDSAERVQENFRRFCAAVGIPAEDVVKGWLVHGRDAAVVTAADRGKRMSPHDILLTNAPGVPLFMTFADCVPLILYDPRRKAIALAHAGWRGTALRVAEAAVRAMSDAFGSRPADLFAGIGPSIGPDHYQVGANVIAAIGESHRQPERLWRRRDDSFWLDLWAANAQQFVEAGVQRVEVARLCTACHLEDFYSHRAEHGRTGRLGALVMLSAG